MKNVQKLEPLCLVLSVSLQIILVDFLLLLIRKSKEYGFFQLDSHYLPILVICCFYMKVYNFYLNYILF